MQHVEDYSDARLKSWCIHCGVSIANSPASRDHVPTKSLLSKELRERGKKYDSEKVAVECRTDKEAYLPQVMICKDCNSSFSKDESYLLCVLHAVMSGSLYPDPKAYPEAATTLRSNRDVVRKLKMRTDGQMVLFEGLQPFTIYPDPVRIKNVITKNARGHA